MELVDYARLRWKALLVAFVIGVMAVGAVSTGGLTRDKEFTASTQLLIRPPTSQLSVFAYDLDRYIATEIATLYSDASLKAEASGTSLTPSELKAALTTVHDAKSDVVTFQVQAPNREDAISVVNHVAEVYLADANARSLESNSQSESYLSTRLGEERDKVRVADRQLAQAYRAQRDSQAQVATADPVLLAPKAYSQQQTSLAAVQQLQQELLQLQLSSQVTGLSRVLNAAESASPSVEPWHKSTLALAILGLLLALLTLAAVGLIFSSRVVSQSRWDSVTATSHLRPAVRGRATRQRPGDVRRIAAALANTGLAGPATIAFFPTATKRSRRAAARLARDLQMSGVSTRDEGAEFADSSDAGEGQPPHDQPQLIMVDLSSCRLEDVAILADSDPARLERVVPVLI